MSPLISVANPARHHKRKLQSFQSVGCNNTSLMFKLKKRKEKKVLVVSLAKTGEGKEDH